MIGPVSKDDELGKRNVFGGFCRLFEDNLSFILRPEDLRCSPESCSGAPGSLSGSSAFPLSAVGRPDCLLRCSSRVGVLGSGVFPLGVGGVRSGLLPLGVAG